MNAIEPLVDEAREHLITRAKREGLVTVGYGVMDSPLGPLWVAVGPRGVLAVHYGARPDERELARITRAYGPGVVPDRRRCDRLLAELDEYFAGRRRRFEVEVDLSPLTPFQRRVLTPPARGAYGGVDYQTAPTPEQQAVYGEIFKWFEANAQRIADGGAELQPTRTATTIRKRGGKASVMDGPFVEAKESVGGFTIFELPDKDAAVALARTWPGDG